VTVLAPAESNLRVFSLASRILESVQLAATDLSITLPPKQYITSGEAVHDAEQVVVTVLGLATGIPDASNAAGIPHAICAPTWQQEVRVDIVRCVPNWKADRNGIVPGDTITESLRSASEDAGILLEAIGKITTWPDNFGDTLASINFPAPSGGFQAVTAGITVVLP